MTIYSHLQSQGWQVEREHLLVRGFPVQFLAASGLTEEAVRESERIDYEGGPAKVFRGEHIVAIAASVGRAKDKGAHRATAPAGRPRQNLFGKRVATS